MGTATFGIGRGETAEVAWFRAQRNCRRNVTFLPMIESRTIMYETIGKFGVCKVIMRPLPRGAGLVAGPVVRRIFECFGLQDINAKVIGRSLAKHQLFAVWEGLSRQRSLRQISLARGVNAYKMFERGVKQPKAPPREVLEERAAEIHRKLKEVYTVMEPRLDDEHLKIAQAILPAEKIAEVSDKGKIVINGKEMNVSDIPDGMELPNDVDNDDILAAEDEVEASNRDADHWGPFMIPPTYVPTLPGRMPRIPNPAPNQQQTASFDVLNRRRKNK